MVLLTRDWRKILILAKSREWFFALMLVSNIQQSTDQKWARYNQIENMDFEKKKTENFE